LLPLAAFYSAISLALATFARSTKEGQYYLTPLLLVTLGLTLFCLSPAIEIEPFYSILPVVGPALLLKEVLASPGNTGILIYALPVLATSIAYSLAGLWWAIAMFTREDVLFREAERFDVRLWIRHLLRDKEQTPSSAEAVLCFVLIMLLQFGALRFMQGGLITEEGTLNGAAMLRLLLVQQLVLVGSPALFMGIMLTSNALRTFRVRLPPWEHLIMACLLPLAIHPLSIALQTWLQWFFPPLPKHVVELMGAISNPNLPLWLLLLAMAGAPALCEEVAFRGFILSGFLRSARPAIAIVLSSVAFGVMHMVPQQVFNATLLGILLGLFAVRSGSLLCGVIFHFVYNSLEVLRMRASSIHPDVPVTGWFSTLVTKGGDTSLQYNSLTLIVAAVAAAFMIARLAYVRPYEESVDLDDDSNDETHASSTKSAQPTVSAR
jgi:sodium transport system permease protein